MGNQAYGVVPQRPPPPDPNAARLQSTSNRRFPVIQIYLRDPIKVAPEMYLIPRNDGASALAERIESLPQGYDAYYAWFGHEDPIEALTRLKAGQRPFLHLDCVQFFIKVDSMGAGEERLIPNYSSLSDFRALVGSIAGIQ